MKVPLLSIKTNSEKQTIEVGQKFAAMLNAGDIVLLKGDLGAGKTHFVKGVAKGLGSDDQVTSPTFTILNIYESGKMPLNHFDMYRINDTEEARAMGFMEYFSHENDGVSIVEWPEQVDGLFTRPYYEITIKKLDGDCREIILGRQT